MTDQPRLNLAVFEAEETRIEAYWRDDELAVGPALSLHVGGVEVMRFDLDPDQPHEHWNHGDQERIYYPPGDPVVFAEHSLRTRWRHACHLILGRVPAAGGYEEAVEAAVAYIR